MVGAGAVPDDLLCKGHPGPGVCHSDCVVRTLERLVNIGVSFTRRHPGLGALDTLAGIARLAWYAPVTKALVWVREEGVSSDTDRDA